MYFFLMKTKTYIPYVVHKYRHNRHTDIHTSERARALTEKEQYSTAQHSTAKIIA